MRVACIQLSTGENILLMLKLIYKSIKLKADLILTPEATTLSQIQKNNRNVHYMRGDSFIDCIKRLPENIRNGSNWVFLLKIKTLEIDQYLLF